METRNCNPNPKMINIAVRFLTENTDHDISVEPRITVLQFKELLRQKIPFFQRFSSIQSEVLKLSLEGFDGGELTGNTMEDGRPLSAYPLTEERHPVLLSLERPIEKIGCPRCLRPFVQWNNDRLRCGDANEEDKEGVLEKRKARIPQLLNCGHSVCLECWKEGLVAAAEATAEEKAFLLVDPSLLTEEGAKKQNQVALEKTAEKARREREREKAENVWKFVCCEKSCGVATYWRNDQERSCHRGMQRLVHLKKREWVEAEKARGNCFFCERQALFRCPGCKNMNSCLGHCQGIHQMEGLSDHVPHVPRVLLSSQVHSSIADIFKTRFCCYCGGGEAAFCVSGGASGRPHCEHGDAGLGSARTMTKAKARKQLTTLESLQADCWRQLVTWNGVMEQLQEHRVKGVERIRKEFDDLISRLETRKKDMVEDLRRRYREKEMELVEKMEALGALSGELQAGLVHHRQSLAETVKLLTSDDAEVCVLRDVVDLNAVQERMSQLASEASRESLSRFSEISMEFEGSDAQEDAAERFCQISELVSNRLAPTQPKLSKKQKYQELEQRVPVISPERNVNTSTIKETAARADRDKCFQESVEFEAPLGAAAKTADQSTTADSRTTATAKTESNPPQTKLKRFPVVNEESLLKAAESGCLEEVEYLVRNGVNVNYKNNLGGTPLHLSASGGHLEVVKYLLQQQADIHCKNRNGWTPLHLSAQWGHVEVVKHLLYQGADKTIKDKSGRVPYDVIRMVDTVNKDVKEVLRNLLKVN